MAYLENLPWNLFYASSTYKIFDLPYFNQCWWKSRFLWNSNI